MAGPGEHRLEASAALLRLDPDGGLIRGFEVRDAGRRIAPLHRAPWAGSPIPRGLPPHLTRLEGDFFCAPFADGGGAAPVLHGWPGNGRWEVGAGDAGPPELVARLERQVQGARVEKRLRLIDGHPFLYQSHRFLGGAGALSAANHAMVALPGGGRLSFSPKRVFRTPAAAPEPDPARGRSCLAYPAAAADPRAFPAAGGGTVDLTRYPWGPAHEDFVIALEAEDHGRDRALGWTAVVRLGRGDAFLSLRNARQLPMTMLWHSNGGRDYAPWSSRHRACLGVEEGRAPHMLGEEGGFALSPGGVLDIRHAIGAIAWPGEAPISRVAAAGGVLRIEGEDGAVREVPFDVDHLFPDRGSIAS